MTREEQVNLFIEKGSETRFNGDFAAECGKRGQALGAATKRRKKALRAALYDVLTKEWKGVPAVAKRAKALGLTGEEDLQTLLVLSVALNEAKSGGFKSLQTLASILGEDGGSNTDGVESILAAVKKAAEKSQE